MGFIILFIGPGTLSMDCISRRRHMPDKPGARFQYKRGHRVVLWKDSKGGHLRPYADGKQPCGSGCASMILLVVGIGAVIAYTVSCVVAAI